MPKVYLHEFEGLGLILSSETGIIYCNQVAGFACKQLEFEGAFVPLFDGIGSPAIHALTQHFRGAWNSVSNSDADVIDRILRSVDLSFITTDRNRLNDSFEAWIHVEIHEDSPSRVLLYQPARLQLLSGFNGIQKGILTWLNSD